MATVKTAFSVEKPLFQRADEMARELKVPRSRVLNQALREFFSHHDERVITEKLNAVHADTPPDPSEQALLVSMRRHHWRLMKGQW